MHRYKNTIFVGSYLLYVSVEVTSYVPTMYLMLFNNRN